MRLILTGLVVWCGGTKRKTAVHRTVELTVSNVAFGRPDSSFRGLPCGVLMQKIVEYHEYDSTAERRKTAEVTG
jgi:hypothetical protein